MTAARVLVCGAAGAAIGYAASARPEHVAVGAVAGVVAGLFASGAGSHGGGSAPGAPPAGGGAAVFRTPIDAADLHPAGWADIGGGVEVMRLPLVDARAPELFARLSYDDAAALAQRWGVRMMTPPVGLAVWRAGFRLALCNQPTAHMMAIGACEAHDACVRAQLAGERAHQGGFREKWDGRAPVANCGKDWIEGAVPDWALNWGWIQPNGAALQQGLPGQRTHERSYTDYSQLTRFWRPAGNA